LVVPDVVNDGARHARVPKDATGECDETVSVGRLPQVADSPVPMDGSIAIFSDH
jgi:hypothetical protein